MIFQKTKKQTELTGRAVAFGVNEAAGLRPSIFLRENLPDEALSPEAVASLIDDLHAIHGPGFGLAMPGSRSYDVKNGDYTGVRIAQLFDETGFDFSVDFLRGLHRRIFSDFAQDAGAFRTASDRAPVPGKPENHEWLASPEAIPAALAGLFAETRAALAFGANAKSVASPQALAAFSAGLWQIHPFALGNTRTLVLFLFKYFQASGMAANASPLWEQAVGFREALIMANPQAAAYGTEVIVRPLEALFEVILYGSV